MVFPNPFLKIKSYLLNLKFGSLPISDIHIIYLYRFGDPLQIAKTRGMQSNGIMTWKETNKMGQRYQFAPEGRYITSPLRKLWDSKIDIISKPQRGDTITAGR